MESKAKDILHILLGLLCFIGVFVIPCVLIVAFDDIWGLLLENVVPIIVVLGVIVFASLLAYIFYRLLGNSSISKFARITWAIVLTIVVLAIIAYISYLVGDYYGWPNDAHFGRG